MPRGIKKQINYDEEIAIIDAKIQRKHTEIQELKERRAELVAEKEQADLKALSEVLRQTGMTAADVMAMLTNKNVIEESA